MTNQTGELNRIDELVKAYADSSNRKVLTILRQAVTTVLRSNPCLEQRVKDIFESNRMSISIL